MRWISTLHPHKNKIKDSFFPKVIKTVVALIIVARDNQFVLVLGSSVKHNDDQCLHFKQGYIQTNNNQNLVWNINKKIESQTVELIRSKINWSNKKRSYLLTPLALWIRPLKYPIGTIHTSKTPSVHILSLS